MLRHPDSCHSGHCRVPAWQPVPAVSLAGWHVLSLPHDSALYEGQCGEESHHWSGGTHRGSLLRYRHGTSIHVGS